MKIRNCYFEVRPRTRRTFFLCIIVFSTNIILSQTHPTDRKRISSDDIENLRKKVEQFLLLDESGPMTHNSHIYYNISVELLPHDDLLDLTERVVTKGIEVNTYENLSRVYPDRPKSSIEHQQVLEFGRLYSQYAWVLWKKDQVERALDVVQKAMSYISSPNPEDCLRLGVIEYSVGQKEQGWNRIINALMKDTIIEEQDPGYQKAIGRVVKNKFGKEKDRAAFIAEYRKRNAQKIPNLSLTTLNNSQIDIRKFHERIMFVNFFSPVCGSCKQEIPGIRNLYEKFSSLDNVIFIFILNRPDLGQEAIAMFKKSGIRKPVIAVLNNGSV